MKSSESDYQEDQLSENDAGEYDTSQPRDFGRPKATTNSTSSNAPSDSSNEGNKKPWWKKVWNFIKG
jgi:hypothetical protein